MHSSKALRMRVLDAVIATGKHLAAKHGKTFSEVADHPLCDALAELYTFLLFQEVQ
jgi:hypothetical protein